MTTVAMQLGEIARAIDDVLSENTMYRGAWLRELSAARMTDERWRGKTHLIDALVVGTQQLVAEHRARGERIATLEALLRSVGAPDPDAPAR